MGIDVISQFDTLKVKADMNVSDIKALNVSGFLHFKSGAVTSRGELCLPNATGLMSFQYVV